ncbi:hypothetical protein [Paenibacillus contaminans]|nr:hypothetical protein [Paenibacillus contaminans]
MNNKKIAIITENKSDLSELLQKAIPGTRIIKPEHLTLVDLDAFDAIAVLGGTQEKPLMLQPRSRASIEAQIKRGKKVFIEYCSAVGLSYYGPPTPTRFDRLVFCGEDGGEFGLSQGDLLDDQCNTALRSYPSAHPEYRPVLQYIRKDAHRRIPVSPELYEDSTYRALWLENNDRLMVCTIRLCNFVKARFSPLTKWKGLADYIVSWLYDERVTISGFIEDAYSTRAFAGEDSFEARLRESIQQGVSWFREAGLLIDEGREGIMEGIATEIYPDGKQRVLTDVRNDCTGEVSMAYFMHYLLTGDPNSKLVSDRLISVCFDVLQEKEEARLKGMLRWSGWQWGICYQDDAARVLIPQLLKCLYTGSDDYLAECTDALHFLVSTTGTDGTRIGRTNNMYLTEAEIRRLASEPGNFPSGHYNGYYLASLLLGYQLTGIELFKETAVKGMRTIMDAYPNTRREHSETQEMCRLILPLAWLYWVTNDDEHKEWLYRVTKDLQRVRHSSGAYLEWDTGYQANRSVKNDTEECSLLTNNGDPIADFLYSVNWLPIGFMQAYFVTGDDYFMELWRDLAKFMISAQLRSGNKQLHGGWARAFDVELMEVFGLPKDTGWGPWVIESGWTVAEIVSGLAMGAMSERLKPFYSCRVVE